MWVVAAAEVSCSRSTSTSRLIPGPFSGFLPPSDLAGGFRYRSTDLQPGELSSEAAENDGVRLRKVRMVELEGDARSPARSAHPASGLYEAPPDGIAHQRRRLVDVELVHQPRPVRLGGLRADPQQSRYVLGRLPFADHLQHLAFARRERIECRLGLGKVRLDDRSRHLRAQIDSTAGDLSDGLDEIRRRLALENVPLHAGSERFGDVLRLVVAGEEDDLDVLRY